MHHLNFMEKKIIVISAVNLVEGGPLTILQKCLATLSEFDNDKYCVVAIVHDKRLANFSNIEYIELKWPKKNWFLRIFYEYIYSYKLSLNIKPYLWFSLHDVTSYVRSRKRVVYCHNPMPFYHSKIRNITDCYKEFLFSYLYKYLYRINITNNQFVVVQQYWIKKAFVKMFNLNEDDVIVAKPTEQLDHNPKMKSVSNGNERVFFYPAFPRTFKNFEVVCEACDILRSAGIDNFKVVLTMDGSENRYSYSIYMKYCHLDKIRFAGLLSKEKVTEMYTLVDCLIFSSKLETWGLPISEFSIYNKPMIISDLPYAHETAMGASSVSFFNPESPTDLAERMREVIEGHYSTFTDVPIQGEDKQTVNSWNKLFDKILNENA